MTKEIQGEIKTDQITILPAFGVTGTYGNSKLIKKLTNILKGLFSKIH
jgi:hypothetical protein